MIVSRGFIYLFLVNFTLGCLKCPEKQNKEVKTDICRTGQNENRNTYVFQGIIQNEIETVNNTDITETIEISQKYHVSVTHIHQDLGMLKGLKTIQLQIINSCKPLKELAIGSEYLLAASYVDHNIFKIGRCNVMARDALGVTKDDWNC